MLGLQPSPPIASTPPHDLEAERAVLGALLIDPGALDVVRSVVDPGALYSSAHAQIYTAILELSGRGAPFDVVALNGALSARGVLEGVGGTEALAAIAEAVPTSANAEYFARQVAGDALKRAVIEASARAQQLAFTSPSLSGEAVAREAERIVLAATQGANDGEQAVPLSRVARPLADEYLHGGKTGILTGIGGVDDVSGGVFAGQLVLIGARTSHGKTSMLLSVLRHVARRTGPVAIFSLEESKERIAQRCAIADSGVTNTDVRRHELGKVDTQRYFDALERMEAGDIPIHVDDHSETVEEICSRARYLVAREGICMVGVDYAQLVKTEERFQRDVERIGHISKCLKRLATKTGVPVLACAQVNRGVEGRKDRKMGASDLKGSGSLEEDSDQVWIIWRPFKFDSELDPRLGKGLIDKHRGGPTGEFRMTFRPEQEEFVTYEGDRPWAT